MNALIERLERGLKEQLASLTNDIRTAESSLMTTKEGYLKVQGALEIIDVIKNQLEANDDQVKSEDIIE